MHLISAFSALMCVQAEASNPLCGWMGHKNLFAFEEKYDPAAGNNAIDRFLCGTNPIIASTALQVSNSLSRRAYSSYSITH